MQILCYFDVKKKSNAIPALLFIFLAKSTFLNCIKFFLGYSVINGDSKVSVASGHRTCMVCTATDIDS